MSDIYGRQPLQFAGAFSADDMSVTFGGVGLDAGAGLIVQSLNFQYSQPINRIYDLGNARLLFYVAGRPQGQAGLSRIIGPRAVTLAFYEAYGDVCNAGGNTLDFSFATGCGGNTNSGTAAFSISGAVLTNVAGSIQAEQMIFNEQLQLMFASLSAQAS